MTCLLANIFYHETQRKEKFKGVSSLFFSRVTFRDCFADKSQILNSYLVCFIWFRRKSRHGDVVRMIEMTFEC